MIFSKFCDYVMCLYSVLFNYNQGVIALDIDFFIKLFIFSMEHHGLLFKQASYWLSANRAILLFFSSPSWPNVVKVRLHDINLCCSELYCCQNSIN